MSEYFPTPPTAEFGPADLASLVTPRIISLNTPPSLHRHYFYFSVKLNPQIAHNGTQFSYEEVWYVPFSTAIDAHQDLTLTPPSTLSTNSNNAIGVLGCTGSVGQRFILLLAQHPHFTLHAVGASPRSAGKKYKDAVKWKQASPMGKHVEELIVKECKASQFADCDIVFSGLDADVAGEIGNRSITLSVDQGG